MFRGVWVKGVITGRGTKTTTGGDTYTGQWAKDKVRGGGTKEMMYYLFSMFTTGKGQRLDKFSFRDSNYAAEIWKC